MNNFFATRDLYLSAVFYSIGIKLIKVDRQGRLCFFIFEDKDKCNNCQQQYFAKELQVTAKDLIDAIRTLKDLVFAED